MDFLPEEFEEILNIFREEGEEQVQKLNQNLLKLEANPKSNEALSELFREAHSIKGAARMIGLNDIQVVAHKLEDIFGLAREEKLIINAHIVDILCKAVDRIASIIEKQCQNKNEIISADVSDIISQLKDIEILVGHQEIEEAANEQPEIIDKEKIGTYKIFYKNCNDLIPIIQAHIKSLHECSTNTDVIAELYQLFIKLDEEAQKLSECKAKEIACDLRVKLTGVTKGSGILIDPEVQEIDESFCAFIEDLEKIYQKYINQESNTENNVSLENKSSQNEIAEEKDNSLNTADLSDVFEENTAYINNNLALLSANSPDTNSIADIIIEKLEQILLSITDNDIKIIFGKILEIVLFSKESGIKPGIEVIEVIKQSFNTAVGMILFPSNDTTEDPKFITQRLEILLQMLKLSEPERVNPDESQNTNENQNAEEPSKIDYPLTNQHGEVLSKESTDSTNHQDNDKSSDSTTIKTLRVDTNKLDQLVNQVGELIISKIKAKDHLAEIERINHSIEDWYREWNKAKQFIKHLNRKSIRPSDLPAGTSDYSQNKNIYSFFDESSSRFVNLINQINVLYKTIQEDDARLGLIVNGLEEKIKSVRVLPLATIFHMFPRMVRDIARENNKNMELIISGSETSVDKKIIEEIKSPLMHIIRNSIDHGIETPEVRLKNGKNPVGKIFLSAYHLENSVLIEVIDDGKGIDIEAIKRKALQKGFLSDTELQSMSDDQVMNIIFWPGFSTGEVVTDISGRGIGLDIVHTKITQLNGKVNIKSTFGEGCKVSIQLPVTMATIKSFLVRVNNQTFAIPTVAIKMALLIKQDDIFFKEGRETIIVDNKTIPICRLSKILEMPDEKLYKKDDKFVVIIIQAEDVQVGFIIDKLLGDQEILHKNLAPPLLRVRNIAGVTTIGSGELCLIINVNDLVKSAYLTFGMSKKQLVIDKQSNVAIVKKNILVVDDSVTTRILERNILRTAGYNVTVAINGLDALTKLLSEKFDLVLSDIEMPDINGFELTERLRTDNRFKDIPIILVTSLASEIDKKKGLSLGANAYITKGGFNQEELLNTIKRLIN